MFGLFGGHGVDQQACQAHVGDEPHPRTGFHVASVHSIFELSAIPKINPKKVIK